MIQRLQARLSQWKYSLTNYTKDDVKDVAGILLMHKFFFSLGLMSALVFRLPTLVSKEGWSVKEVVTSSTTTGLDAMAVALVVGMAALPWIVTWRYLIYPRVKAYPLLDFVTHLFTVGFGILAMVLFFAAVTQSPEEAVNAVQNPTVKDDAGLVETARWWVQAGMMVFSGTALTTLWERYLDDRLTLHTPRRRTAAVLGVALLIIAPGVVGAVPASMVGAGDAVDHDAHRIDVSNKSLYTDGRSGPGLSRANLTRTNTSAGVVVENVLKPAAVPPGENEDPRYTVVSTSYNSTIVTVNNTRVDVNGTTFTPPNHYTFDGPYNEEYWLVYSEMYATEKGNESAPKTLKWSGGELVMENVDHTWFYADIIGPNGEVHRKIVKLDNPAVDGNDENER